MAVNEILNNKEPESFDLTPFYRYTFLRDSQTKTVLANLCLISGFFDEVKTEQQRIETNFVKEILSACGIWRPENAIAIIDAIENINVKKKE